MSGCEGDKEGRGQSGAHHHEVNKTAEKELAQAEDPALTINIPDREKNLQGKQNPK
jgi:hypothetical protein